MKKIWISFVLCLLTCAVTAQKYTISGYLDDVTNGEKLIGASIFELASSAGTVSNVYGFYSITLPAGTYDLQYSYIGYQSVTKTVELSGDVDLNISLEPSVTLQEVEIIAEATEKIEEKTQMSTIGVPIKQIKSLPALGGEVDILKVMQLLPGVQSGTEGGSGIYVRGGGPDQNLILLDGVPVYNVSHLFGFFSVFNADAIRNVELIKGGFPARYGGRLSSVININMKEGNSKEFHGEGSIGLIASKLTLEGPIIKDKTSFIVSGRRTYIDLLTRPIIKASGTYTDSFTRDDGVLYESKNTSTGGYYFYDLNAKINHKFSDKDRLYLSLYAGRDKGGFKDEYESSETTPAGVKIGENSYNEEFGLGWGNVITALRWNHKFSNKLFANTSLTYSEYDFLAESIYSDYAYSLNIDESFNPTDTAYFYQGEGEFGYSSDIKDIGLKIDFDYVPSPKHYVKFGANAIRHRFQPGVLSLRDVYGENDGIDTSFTSNSVNAVEAAVYVEDDFKISPKLKINFGLHTSMFDVKDTTYFSLQPRFSARYLLNPSLSLKASYANMTQYLHLLSNSSLTLPTDLWVPPTNIVGPQRAWQAALGIAKTFRDVFEISVEGYYKEMKDLISYKEGASFLLVADNWEDKVTVGDGTSYGAELFIQKKKGKTTGWLGYTWSKTTRQFPGRVHENIPDLYFEPINFGEEYPYKYDRRHDISLVVTHRFNEKWELSGAWVYGTGNAITLPVAEYQQYDENFANNNNGDGNFYYYFNQNVLDYSGKNAQRMGAYHRLDIGLNLHTKPKWGEGKWSFSVYNVYNRKNPFFIYQDNEYDPNLQQSKDVFKQVSLFPIIPSFAYAFKF